MTLIERLFGKERSKAKKKYADPRMRMPSDFEFGATFVDSEHNMPGDQEEPPRTT